jgi:hypothetical protein
MSWAPCREIAAYYGYESWRLWGRTAEPILLRREISREQVIAYFINQEGEAVVDGPLSYEINTHDAGEIAALAAAAEPIVAESGKRSERIKAEFMAMTEDELFAGWEE